jgi:hypothetical protein
MEHGLVARIADRMTADARMVKEAPKVVFVLLGIMTLGLSYLVLQEFHRERLAVLNDRIASQEALLGEYRTKLKGATPEQAASQIEQLTKLLGDTQKALNDVAGPRPKGRFRQKDGDVSCSHLEGPVRKRQDLRVPKLETGMRRDSII